MSPKAHTRFRLDWKWDGKEAALQSRCTDDKGEVQPSVAEIAKIWGVKMDYFEVPGTIDIGNFNAIHTWKVNRDGSVHNALV